MPPATATRATGTVSLAAPGRPPVSATPTRNPTSCALGVDLLGFSDALDKVSFEGTTVGGLSALAYDSTRGLYYALVDNERDTPARVYTLRLPLDGGRLGTPEILAVTTLRDAGGQPFTGRTFDGEGFALLPGGDWLLASETEPSIRHFAPDGGLRLDDFMGQPRDRLDVPPRFLVRPGGEAGENQTFESLTLAPDSLTLFAAVEGPLAPDGFTADLRPRLRLLRYTSRPPFLPAAQYFYLAEPAQGLSELLALSATELLALERGFIPGLGNTVRVFRVSLAGATDVTDRPALSEPGPLPKRLLVDLGACPPGDARHPGRQATPLLDNFEGLALGPPLPDGRQTLLLISDDNFARDQVTRIVVLAFRP